MPTKSSYTNANCCGYNTGKNDNVNLCHVQQICVWVMFSQRTSSPDPSFLAQCTCINRHWQATMFHVAKMVLIMFWPNNPSTSGDQVNQWVTLAFIARQWCTTLWPRASNWFFKPLRVQTSMMIQLRSDECMPKFMRMMCTVKHI